MNNSIELNKSPHKLTNLDISEQYRDRKYWLMRSDFMGAFAYWAVTQSPYDTPNITPALKAFSNYINSRFEKDLPIEFTYEELSNFINEDVFESIPEIEKLNHPKIDTGSKIMFTSRYCTPKPDYDFIDLGALAKNVRFMILRESITQN